MESAPSSICKVCQGIFQEGHRRRIRLRRIEEHLWESKGSSDNQDTWSNSSGENGQETIDSVSEEADDDASKRPLDEEKDMWESSDEVEDMPRFSDDEEDLDEGAEDDASKGPSDEEEELRKSSDEELDSMANEGASEVFSDDEHDQPFGGPDYFVYMHYPNLAMLQKSAEHCQSCHVLMQSLPSPDRRFVLEQAQELESQRLQELQSSGDRAQPAALDEDESDPNLESALRMHVEVVKERALRPSLISKEHGEGRIFLIHEEERLDYEFIQDATLNVFCKPTESSDNGHLESDISFLASPGECEIIFSQLFVQVLTLES